jgi:hypothetical protein
MRHHHRTLREYKESAINSTECRYASSQATLESGRNSKLDQIDSKITQVEEKINETTEANVKKINSMKEQLSKLQRSLEDEKSSREQFFELRAKELKVFESKMLERFENESSVIF